MLYNPSLQEESRHQKTKLMPPNHVEPLLKWLEQTGRLSSRGVDTEHNHTSADELIDEIVDANAYSDDVNEADSLEND